MMTRQRQSTSEFLSPWSSNSRWKGKGKQFGMINPASGAQQSTRARRDTDFPIRKKAIRSYQRSFLGLNSVQLATLIGMAVSVLLMAYIVANFF